MATSDLLAVAVATLAAGPYSDAHKAPNERDVAFLRDLTRRPALFWTPRQRKAIWNVCVRYPEQLQSLGIDVTAIPEPPDAPKRPVTPKEITWDAEHNAFRVLSGYDPALVAKLRGLPNASWDPGAKHWVCPVGTDHVVPKFMEELVRNRDFKPDELAYYQIYELQANPNAPRYIIPLKKNPKILKVVFPYNPVMVDEIHNAPDARYDRNGGFWRVPLNAENLTPLLAFAERFNLRVTPAVRKAAQRAQARFVARIAASKAEDAAFEVAGLTGELRAFQRAGIAYATRAKRTFIADAMGLGKTIQGLATVKSLDTFPVIVVCPASAKLNWLRELNRWVPDMTAIVVNGTQGSIEHADFIIINYDILQPRLVQLRAMKPKAVIFDESHYLKNRRAQRTQAARRLVRGITVRLLLTGTPVLNRPSELISQLEILGRLASFGGYYRFITRYCGAVRNKSGYWEMTSATHSEELNEKLRASCYIRREKMDVLTELPEKQRTMLYVPITNQAAYDAAEKDVVAFVQGRVEDDHVFMASIMDKTADEQLALIAEKKREVARRTARAEQFARINILRQLVADGKLPAIIEWITSALEQDEKIIVFASHRRIQHALVDAFPTCAHILGSDDTQIRKANEDRFQTDPNCRIIICSIKAAGQAINLTAASHVVFAELAWTPGDLEQAEDRAHRLGQQNPVNVWYFLAEETIDTEMWDLLALKNTVTKGVTVGGALDGQKAIFTRLIARLSQRVSTHVSGNARDI